MGDWMRDFLQLFPVATEGYTGTRQDLDAVERILSDDRSSLTVTRRTLRAIENNSAWTYPTWWPVLSDLLEEPVILGAVRRDDSQDRRRAIQHLYDRLQHIEVVSVVLRFLLPEEFGIISPPVSTLLCLPPASDHVSHYDRYLETLKDLGRPHGISRVADVDMALWSAAHLQYAYSDLAREMYRDEHLQVVRLRNMLHDLGDVLARANGRRHRIEIHRHLLLARALMEHDHISGALIAARAFEEIVNATTEDWEIQPREENRGRVVLTDRLDEIKHRGTYARLGVGDSDLDSWRAARNDIMHAASDWSKRRSEWLVEAISRLYADWSSVEGRTY